MNVTAKPGELIKLECEVQGSPRPNLVWIHNGKLIEELNQKVRILYLEN